MTLVVKRTNLALIKRGFQRIKHTSNEKDVEDDTHIKTIAYPEVEELIKKV